MKVLCIISRDLDKGSTKYRIVQYTGFLRDRGIDVSFVRRDEIDASRMQEVRDADVLLNQKCLPSLALSRKVLKQSRRAIFDFDDAIYTRPGRPHTLFTSLRVKRRFRFWLRESDLVTTASNFLAERAYPYASSVVVIPMAVDTDIWRPAPARQGDMISMGWAGSPATLHMLERLGPVLSSLLHKNSSLKLSVFSGRRPDLPCPFEYRPFSPGAEPSFIQGLDIGLLPLPDEEYTRGKSPIKAIQYLACGVPVVGNIIGASAEILRPDNSIGVSGSDGWADAVEGLIHNPGLRASMGSAGRDFVLKNHSLERTGEKLLRLLSGRDTDIPAGEDIKQRAGSGSLVSHG